jgi:hypothetical protein
MYSQGNISSREIKDSEYYNKEVKLLKAKVRSVYMVKLEKRCQVKPKSLSKELLAAKRTAQKTFLWSGLRNEGSCWSEFYKYVKSRKENKEIVPAIKDRNEEISTQSTGKANTSILISYYISVFCCDHNIPKIQLADSGETFIININY